MIANSGYNLTMTISFDLTSEQEEQYLRWREEQEKAALRSQFSKLEDRKKTPEYKMTIEDHLLLREQQPYYGCIGGGCTFEFTPTTIGVLTVIRHNYTGEKLVLENF